MAARDRCRRGSRAAASRSFVALCLSWSLLLQAGCSCNDAAEARPHSNTAPKHAEQGRGRFTVVDEPDPHRRRGGGDLGGFDYFAPANMPSTRGAGSGRAVYVLAALGVPECDRLLETLNECYMPRLSDQDQVRVLASLKQQYRHWSQMAGDEAQRERGASDCRDALTARTAVFEKMDCTP